MYQKTSEEGRILKDVREMTKLLIESEADSGRDTTAPTAVKPIDVIKALSYNLGFEMFMKGIEPTRQLRENGKKRFYTNLDRLVKSGLVYRKKIGEYEPTSGGIIVQEAVKLIEKFLQNVKQLNVCDNYHFLPHGHTVSEELIINAIVTDPELRDILLEKRVPAGAEDPKRYIGPGSG